MSKATKVGLDFETYSALSLKKHGIPRYVQHPTFKVLLGGIFTPLHNDPLELDFVHHESTSLTLLKDYIQGQVVVAHNVPFEYSVLERLGLEKLPLRYEDSANAARAKGGSGDLRRAALQFTGVHKMEEGRELINLFSIPGKYQTEENPYFNNQVIADHQAEWGTYMKYCGVDAQVGMLLTEQLPLPLREQRYADITLEMNMRGWPVDRDVVQEMYARYLENQAEALSTFQVAHNAKDLNLNSLPQQKKWCEERGIRARSFDEQAVEKLIRQIEKRLVAIGSSDPQKVNDYTAVLDMLHTKQVLGGSSLKKLKVILDTIVQDKDGVYRLKDQYFHIGAGQSWRTSGRGAQLQNLKQMGQTVRDMQGLFDPDEVWTNDDLAENIRQCFTSSRINGRLLVGDFSSIESRGLAWQAQETWKVDAYRAGRGVYEELAARIYRTNVKEIIKGDPRRNMGKVGELSCGYGAAGGAVQRFALKYGLELNEAEAQKLVYDWRDACPATVRWWATLDAAIKSVVENDMGFQVMLPDGFMYVFKSAPAPVSLMAQVPGAKTLVIDLLGPNGDSVMTRYFHGVHSTGRNTRYYKPSKRKHGDLWTDRYKDPKTGHIRFYEIYGGKMAGILTQSLCREIFFERLAAVEAWSRNIPNFQLIGQFHDEIVVDWWPGAEHLDARIDEPAVSLEVAERMLERMMSTSKFPSLPMGAEVKHDYRYTK